MSSEHDARTAAALVIKDVIVGNNSLNRALEQRCECLQTQDVSLAKAICFGVCRHFLSLDYRIQPLLQKPLRNKDKDIYALLLIGVYQLVHMRVPDYAAIDSCVKSTRKLKKPWAGKLVNAVLRKCQQTGFDNALPPSIASEHPSWLYDKILQHWPEKANDIFVANNEEPPLCLRINLAKTTRHDYQALLSGASIESSAGNHSPAALYLPDRSVLVHELPGYDDGLFSVQDEAAQLSALLLECRPGDRVLDACAAPGGKTCHILEHTPDIQSLLAIDIDPQRLETVSENLQRLQLHARTLCADIADSTSWWDGQPFDRILCDAPCSATGVIRRHPDIKLLRKPGDIEQLATTQLAILQSLWSCLAPGGQLLYATCSILPEENSQIISRFCAIEDTCEEITIDANYGIVCHHGRQLFPLSGGTDGFFYAKLQKRAHE